MPRKGTFIAFILIILVLFFIEREIIKRFNKSKDLNNQTNHTIVAPVDKSTSHKPVQQPESNSGIVIKLTPEDPAKYGMVVQEPGTTPRTAEAWEGQLRETFEKQKTFESEAAQKALETAKTSPADYQKQMQDLNNHIQLFQDKLKINPLDEDADAQLQILYQLKAVGKILKEKVVSQEASPIQNAVPGSVAPPTE